MQQEKRGVGKSICTYRTQLVALAILLTGCFGASSMAQQPGQKTFATPDEAANSLVTAAQSNDEKTMLEILGPAGKEVVSSGDEAEDAESRANFAKRYQEMHRLVREPDGTVTLYIGAENWPTPIPLMNKGHAWFFDTEAGKKEVLFRRIGRNEMSAIRVCQELVAAQKEYYAEHNEYAAKIVSDEGQHNGLYWKTAAGEPKSPVGPLVAAAITEGDAKSQKGSATPYRGYYYRLLIAQGKNAPGGAKNYLVNGKMSDGFAFVAFPAEYRSSGVVTFIVNQDGVVYQKDLGKKTDALAKAMKDFDPGPGWQKNEEQPEESAAEQKTK
jgi:Protein of unknown function (DUF2950)